MKDDLRFQQMNRSFSCIPSDGRQVDGGKAVWELHATIK